MIPSTPISSPAPGDEKKGRKKGIKGRERERERERNSRLSNFQLLV
jgi:hypothetical protein